MPILDFDDWWKEWSGDALLRVKNRLSKFAVLRAHTSLYATQSVAAASVTIQVHFTLAETSALHAEYLRDEKDAGRVLFRLSLLEALRLCLAAEPVEDARRKLVATHQSILRWRYVDQLFDEDVAAMLGLRDARGLHDATAGRQSSIDAYVALVDAIVRRSPSAYMPSESPLFDPTTVFPLFPSITRDQLPRFSKGKSS
jgi:hypothetical protein